MIKQTKLKIVFNLLYFLPSGISVTIFSARNSRLFIKNNQRLKCLLGEQYKFVLKGFGWEEVFEVCFEGEEKG